MSGPFHLAVVHGADDVHLVVAGPSRETLLERLARALEGEVDVQLWDEEATRFRALLEAGDAAGAVEHYFRKVGERWDPAHLRIETVTFS